jgi:two-component sensor histidine kinase
MALIHEKLYRSHDLARIDFGDYVQNLTSSLLLTYNVNKHKIKLKYNIEKIFFDVDTAIPCGLLINELVSNCIKHAFGKDDSGEIKIELYTDEDNCYSMIVKDNGKGFPETVDFRNTKTLGMQLVVTLADQLDAVVSMDNHVGTSFLIKFKEIKYKERASKVN